MVRHEMTKPKTANDSTDDRYFQYIQEALLVCKSYRPKLGAGHKEGLSVEEFQVLYGEDPFYAWFGLDSPLVYSAHRAAGGMTSLYRQIGIAGERLFREVLKDTLSLDDDQAKWSYSVPSTGGKGTRTLSLDGRIPIDEITDAKEANRVRRWLKSAAKSVGVDAAVMASLKGPVFEVRQGYKSKDSKRQNADIGNASNAYAHSYLPVVVLFSIQIDPDVAERYTRAQWVLLRGSQEGTSLTSTYVFAKDVLGYDLAGFFERNSPRIKSEVISIIKALLQ